jgi:hypothetical protein
MNECIEWSGRRQSAGYGLQSIKGKNHYVHRLEWARHNGPIPDGMVVCHTCDNPPCYNIEHLFLGTQKDNVRDMYAKGRTWQPKGEDRKNSKLIWDAVNEIRELHATGQYSQRALAKKFGVAKRTIATVVHNITWVA